jgi:hypothetical protein
MVTYHKLLEGSRLKVERSKKHVQDLNIALKAFFDTNPYEFLCKRDPETRQPVYYLNRVEETPPNIAVIAGDVIQSLRSALDHLAYQLVLSGTGKPGPFRYVSFPIFDSPDEYETKKSRRIKGMRPGAVKAIDAVKPYKGGNDLLWRLDHLNRIDKHRLLLTVGAHDGGIDVGYLATRHLRNDYYWSDFPIVSAVYYPTGPMKHLEVGDVLFTDEPDAEVDKDMKFPIRISIAEPQVIGGETVLETLQHMIDLVDNLIPSFSPLLD